MRRICLWPGVWQKKWIDAAMGMHFSADLELGRLLALDVRGKVETLEEFLEHVRERYDLAGIAYHSPAVSTSSSSRPLGFEGGLTTTSPMRDFGETIFRLARRTTVALDWSDLPRPAWNARRILDKVRDEGTVRQGLTIPLHGPSPTDFALFSVTSSESDEEWRRRSNALLKEMYPIAHYVHQCARNLDAREEPAEPTPLGSREVEMLQWLADGCGPEAIARETRSSTTVVDACLESARYKLGALTLTHALVKALRAGLIH
jgi:DNA-binding CsgD family transcriptional regulator